MSKYLTHATQLDNLLEIMKSGYLYTSIERDILNIRSEALSSYETPTLRKYLSDFPGVFMTLNDHFVTRMPGPVIMVFNSSILELQKNFHINLIDRNGFLWKIIRSFTEKHYRTQKIL